MVQKVKSDTLETADPPRVVACIPAYDEENSIGPVILRARSYVDLVLVCDDGSSDLTGVIAAMMGASVITHERNMGYGAAIRSLFEEARRLGADVVVTLDADGQHDPSEIGSLLSRLDEGDVDIVIGSRFVDGGGSEAPGWREKGIRLLPGLGLHLAAEDRIPPPRGHALHGEGLHVSSDGPVQTNLYAPDPGQHEHVSLHLEAGLRVGHALVPARTLDPGATRFEAGIAAS